MKTLLYVTGNTVKFKIAHTICSQQGIDLEQLSMDIPEIQAHDGEIVARDKALRVFETVQQPVVISDDTWLIPGLKNFPGPFMKFVNEAFTTEDWLRLTKTLTDRRIILRQIVVFQDKHQQQLFYTDIEGTLLTEIRGQGPYPHTAISSFDNGKTSIAENIERNRSAISDANKPTSWHDFCTWFAQKNAEHAAE
jgi:non-canonical purine NTP pyrophosphatase (RdgB/HAM1 family)